MKYRVAKNSQGHWAVYKNNKMITVFRGEYARADANIYVQQCIENDNWNASNRD